MKTEQLAKIAVKVLRKFLPHSSQPASPQAEASTPKAVVIAANVAARVVVYGAIFTAVYFLLPEILLMSIPFLALSAAQPWTNEGFAWVHDQAYKRWPKVIGWIDNQVGGATHRKSWWKNAFVFIPSLALAVVHPAHIPGFIFQAVVPVLLLSGLPIATNYLTKLLEKIPLVGIHCATSNALSNMRRQSRREMVEFQVLQKQKQNQMQGPSIPSSRTAPGTEQHKALRRPAAELRRIWGLPARTPKASQPRVGSKIRNLRVIGRRVAGRQAVKGPQNNGKSLG